MLLSLVPAVSGCGAVPGKVGGVSFFERSRHHPQMQMTSGNGSNLWFFFFDCCLCISVMMSSTGRSAGHEGGEDCASSPAPRI